MKICRITLFFLSTFLLLVGCGSGIQGPSVQKSTVTAPVISVASGTYISMQSVVISCATEGALIYYTRDGAEPTESSLRYTDPITVDTSMTIRAAAFKTDCLASDVVSASYVITGKVESPVISVESGTYTSTQSVVISCAAEGARIYYTIDGAEPTESSLRYTDPITVDTSMTIRAAAFKTDWLASDVVSASYVITGKVESPVISVESGTYTAAQSVVISCAAEGVLIYYTIDGTEPTESSLRYTDPITVDTSMTIRAAAFKTGWMASDEVSASYVITGTVNVVVTIENPSVHVLSFSSARVEITRGNSLSVSTSNEILSAIETGWKWYVDGVQTEEEGNMFVWDTAGKQIGSYILSASVQYENITYSGSFKATVTY